MNQDREHLRLLSICHYVVAGVTCLLPLVALVYIGMGVMILSGKMPSSPPSAHADLLTGWMVVGVGGFLFLMGALGVTLNFLVGRSLARCERRKLCLVVAGLNCLHMPLGTILGVFTFLVLGRPSVQALFNPPPPEERRNAWPAAVPSHPSGPQSVAAFSGQNP